jgi:thiamine-phosphate pyrophosphorylase
VKLIVISNPVNLPDEVAQVHKMFELGLRYFHVRKPSFTTEEMTTYLLQIDSQYFDRVIIHNHEALKESFNLKGVHYNKYSSEVISKQYHSASCHSLDEVNQKKVVSEYLFLSPIFDSISKEGYGSGFDTQSLKLFLSNYKGKPLIALGGIDDSKVEFAKELGFNGVAVLGAIWNKKEPVSAFENIKNKIKNL